MNYRSYADLVREVQMWAATLRGRYDLIAGIPRSGMLPATLLALELNLPLTDLKSLVRGEDIGLGHRKTSAATGDVTTAKRVLVLDDSADSGRAMSEARALLDSSPMASQYVADFGAVYVTPRAKDAVDEYRSIVPHPRVFEWNVYHHGLLGMSCLDIDGVLCVDPTVDENDDGPRYLDFLTNATPLHVPTVEVGWLVTSRLERYRPETEKWLADQGVRYRELIMHPASTGSERLALADHAKRKAAAFRSARAHLFVESSLSQAAEIANLTLKPVFCVDANRMVVPGEDLASTYQRTGFALRLKARLLYAGRQALKRLLIRYRLNSG